MEAYAVVGVRYRILVDFVAECLAHEVRLYESEITNQVMEILSPVSFVRLVGQQAGQDLYVQLRGGSLRARLPFLSPEEDADLIEAFEGLKVPMPSLYSLASYWRTQQARTMRASGLGTREIARRLGLTPRGVRMIASRERKGVHHD